MYVQFLGWVVGIATGIWLVLAVLARLGLRLARKRPRRFWLPVFGLALVLVPLHVFVTAPNAAAWLAVGMARTRGDEIFYVGPRLGADGHWILQERRSWRDVPADAETAPRDPHEARSPFEVWMTAEDGVRVRGFLVPPPDEPPRFVAVLTHGLWRGALEIETVGSMFRDLGGTVLLLELRNHGRSEHATFTFGRTESSDMIAAVQFVRERAELRDLPLVLFGVSLGSAATALAAPRVERLAGLVLDAPIDSVGAVADRMVSGRRRMVPSWAWPDLKHALSTWSDTSIDEVSPKVELKRLAPSVRALVIGGADDARCPPEAAQAVFDAIPCAADAKTLWIEPEADHGKVWQVAPDRYREHLHAFIDAILASTHES
ncbi:MAG: alpha/beta hydrolase [Planctomycetes bacterium]|nr:alpha/beta hydrolase [Planctomycetota bacterium]MCC7170941.1 alpha/beta hydrolase [Planctomycetota bacterium]